MTASAHLNARDRDIETAARLFDSIASMSPDVEGVSRPAFSGVETKTLEFLVEFAKSEGLSAWYDEGCNARFSLPQDAEAKRYVVVGSHVDTVPYGGNYDGLAGVVAALLCLVRAKRSGEKFAFPVHALAMRGEESAWFGPCYIGSKILTGTLAEEEIGSVHKSDGRSLRDHMAEIGLPVDRIAKREPIGDLSAMTAFLEMHIEQGPLLIGKDIPAAVVTGIRGNIRHRQIRCIGAPGHSGAVPRAYRRDAVLAVADLLVRLDESWQTILNKGDDLVLTSGILHTDPDKHAMTRIPELVNFSLDFRSQSPQTLDEMRELLRAEARQVEKDRKVRFEFDRELRVEPAQCDPHIVSELKEAMARAGQEPFTMPSGGGHDAAVFQAAGVPSAMVFVRNQNGSHNPAEAMELGDFVSATDIFYEFLCGASL